MLPASSSLLRGLQLARGSLGVYAAASKRDLLRKRLVLPLNGSRLEVPWERSWAFPGGRYFETDVVRCFSSILERQRAPIVYDVGANCGYFTLLAAHRADAVYAFEPGSSAWAVLARNVERNHLSNVKTFRVAVTDRSEEVQLYLYSSSGNNSLMKERVGVGDQVEFIGTERMWGVPLDQLILEYGLRPPTLLKIDVEGSEFRVLEGADRTLEAYKPAILMEHDEARARAAGYSCADVVACLERYGYHQIRCLGDEVSGASVHPIERLLEMRNGTIVATAGTASGGHEQTTP